MQIVIEDARIVYAKWPNCGAQRLATARAALFAQKLLNQRCCFQLEAQVAALIVLNANLAITVDGDDLPGVGPNACLRRAALGAKMLGARVAVSGKNGLPD